MTTVVDPPALAEATQGGPGTCAERRVRSERRVVATARIALVLQVLVVSWVCFQGYFYFHDDYVFHGQAAGSGWLDPAYLFHYWGGHLMPAAFAVAQPLAKWDDFNYGWIALTLALGQALVGLLLLRLLLRHFGARWRILLPFGLYLTSVPVLQATAWWAAGLNMVPLLACMVIISDHALRTRGMRSWSDYAWILGTYAAALLFFEKAVLVPFLVVMLLLALTPGGIFTAITRVARRHWPLLVGLIAFTEAWQLVYRATRQIGALPSPSIEVLGRQATGGLLEGFLPSLVGGPWTWYRASTGYDAVRVMPAVQGAVIALVALAAIYAATRGSRARRALVLVAGYAVLILLVINIGRQNWLSSSDSVPRYFADLTIVVVIGTAIATARLIDDPAPEMLREWRPRRVPAAAAAALVLAQVSVLFYVAAAIGLVGLTSDTAERRWTSTALRSLRADTTGSPVLDVEVPEYVVSAWYHPFNDYGWVFAGVRGLPAFGGRTDRLRVLDANGALVEGHIEGPRSLPTPGSSCGYVPSGAGVSVPMQSPIIPWAHTMQIAYLANGTTSLEVGMPGGPTYTVPLEPGLHDVFLQFDGGGTSVRLRQTTAGIPVCVGFVRIGQPAPGPPA